MTKGVCRYLAEWRAARRVALLRDGLRPGMRVRYVDESGGVWDGTVLNVRRYSDGSAEGWFQSHASSVSGWKPASRFLPAD